MLVPMTAQNAEPASSRAEKRRPIVMETSLCAYVYAITLAPAAERSMRCGGIAGIRQDAGSGVDAVVRHDGALEFRVDLHRIEQLGSRQPRALQVSASEIGLDQIGLEEVSLIQGRAREIGTAHGGPHEDRAL